MKALRHSSRDFEEWCQGYGKSEWDSQAQGNYLAGVRVALVIGEPDRAQELLRTRKSFKWHEVEHGIWKQLTTLTSDEVVTGTEFSSQFEEYFDRLRDPRFVPDVYLETDILRLELAAIRDKYFVSSDGVIDWSRAVDSVPGK